MNRFGHLHTHSEFSLLDGEQQIKKDRYILTSLGCSVDVVKYDEGFKDAGDYVGHPQEYSSLRTQIKNKLRGLIYGATLSV